MSPFYDPIENHDLQENLAGIDRYLHRLSDTNSEWEQQTSSVRQGVNALQPYFHVLLERRHEVRQTTLPSYFKKKLKEPPIDPKTAKNYPVDSDDPQPGHYSCQ